MKVKVGAVVLMVWAIVSTAAANHIRDFIPSGWQLPAGNAGMVHFKGEECLFLEKGVALLGSEKLQNGILEVDIADDNGNGFAGLVFRHNGQGTYEEVYLRLHKSGQPDALQYSPVHQNSTSWVLYPEFQATSTFDLSSWTHLKVVVQGDSATVYVNDATQPTLVIPDLKLNGQSSGQFGVKAIGGAYFNNFQFTPLPETALASAVATVTAPANTIMRWQVSPAQTVPDPNAPAFPQPLLSKVSWKELTPEPSGLLNLDAHFLRKAEPNHQNATEEFVWLKVEVFSDHDQTKQLFFDYSNKIQIFLNEAPLFSGDNSFRAKGRTFRGDIDKQLQTTAVFLPLKKGKNTMLLALASTANGWGILARWADQNGIKQL